MRDDVGYPAESVSGNSGAGALGRMISVAGAIASVCVVAAVVTWGYRLGARDAHDVPVISALAGETKRRPADPGGERFAHQERSVYAALTGEAEGGEVMLAPPPEAPDDEDAPQATLLKRVEAVAAAPVVPEVAGDDPVEAAEALPGAVAPPAPNPSDEIARLVEQALAEAPPPLALVAPTRAAPETSPRARPRPAALRLAAAAPADLRTASASPSASAPVADRAPGARLQLGAYLSEADANRMWSRIFERNGDLLAGRSAEVKRSVIAGQALYLLRAAPFAATAEAERLCSALEQRGEECFVVGDG